MIRKTFFVNIYRHGSGYMFGDNMIRHASLDEALKTVRKDLEYVCTKEILLP